MISGLHVNLRVSSYQSRLGTRRCSVYRSASRARKVPEAFALAVECQFLAVLDDECGFVINAVFLANLPEMLVLL
jgi:hypothetical protein